MLIQILFKCKFPSCSFAKNDARCLMSQYRLLNWTMVSSKETAKKRKTYQKKKNCTDQWIKDKTKKPRALKPAFAALPHKLLKGRVSGESWEGQERWVCQTGPGQAALLFAGLSCLAGLVEHTEPKIPSDLLKIGFAIAKCYILKPFSN